VSEGKKRGVKTGDCRLFKIGKRGENIVADYIGEGAAHLKRVQLGSGEHGGWWILSGRIEDVKQTIADGLTLNVDAKSRFNLLDQELNSLFGTAQMIGKLGEGPASWPKKQHRKEFDELLAVAKIRILFPWHNAPPIYFNNPQERSMVWNDTRLSCSKQGEKEWKIQSGTP